MLYGLPRGPDHAMTTAVNTRSALVLPVALLLLGTFGFAALWVLLSVSTHQQHSWMAVVGALDIAWMLRLGRWPRGALRIVIGLAATALIVLLANWWIIATHLSGSLGLSPWDAAVRLGWNHAWTLTQLANGTPDIAWVMTALVAAALASR